MADKLICVLCRCEGERGSNTCQNPECNGMCSWGHELGKPLSWTVLPDGRWVPNVPKVTK
jgi:hypothetical protein